MARHRKTPAHRHQAPGHRRQPVGTQTRPRAFSTAMRRVVVTPTFAAGLGVVIAAVLAYPMTRTVISYGARPPAGTAPCVGSDCGTGTQDGGGTPAARPGRRLASPAPAAKHPQPSVPPATGGGASASGQQPVMHFQTLHRWPGGFVGQITITGSGVQASAHWQLRISYGSARIIGVRGRPPDAPSTAGPARSAKRPSSPGRIAHRPGAAGPAARGRGISRAGESRAAVASAGNLPGLDAGRAHAQPLARSVHLGVHDLDVGVEATRGAAVRERDPVAETRPLAADVADSSHGIAPLV